MYGCMMMLFVFELASGRISVIEAHLKNAVYVGGDL